MSRPVHVQVQGAGFDLISTDFNFYIPCRGPYESEHNAQQGGMRQEGRECEGQNSGEQRHEEICGRVRDGAGNTGYTRWT